MYIVLCSALEVKPEVFVGLPSAGGAGQELEGKQKNNEATKPLTECRFQSLGEKHGERMSASGKRMVGRRRFLVSSVAVVTVAVLCQRVFPLLVTRAQL